MFGWSIRARACRSASKRASRRPESRPGRITLRATGRRTGSVWSATQTSPMPPSPSFWRSRKRPANMRPGPSGGPTSTRRRGRRRPAARGCRRRRRRRRADCSTRRRRPASPAHASSRNASSAAGRLSQGGGEQRFFGHRVCLRCSFFGRWRGGRMNPPCTDPPCAVCVWNHHVRPEFSRNRRRTWRRTARRGRTARPGRRWTGRCPGTRPPAPGSGRRRTAARRAGP